MGLLDRINSLTSLFTASSRFGEQVSFYPGGERSAKQTISCIWIEDDLFGTNEVPGDGVALEKEVGRRYRKSYKLEVAASLGVNERGDRPDVFENSAGTVVQLKRILSKDNAMMTLLCVAVAEDRQGRHQRRG